MVARGTSGRAPEAACPPRSGVATFSYATCAAPLRESSLVGVVFCLLNSRGHITAVPVVLHVYPNYSQVAGFSRRDFERNQLPHRWTHVAIHANFVLSRGHLVTKECADLQETCSCAINLDFERQVLGNKVIFAPNVDHAFSSSNRLFLKWRITGSDGLAVAKGCYGQDCHGDGE
jgi:hypothetical protein